MAVPATSLYFVAYESIRADLDRRSAGAARDYTPLVAGASARCKDNEERERDQERVCEASSIPFGLIYASVARILSVPLRASPCPLLTACPACPRRISRQHWWRRW